MPVTKQIKVKDLHLDLFNFRTVQQTDEIQAVKAMISISPDRFWALMESLITDGYLPTENIIVLKIGTTLTVREGNRRIASLKLIYGYISQNDVTLPDNIRTYINNLSQDWKTANLQVPCTIYEQADAALVDKIVTLAHGKGEKASRDQWNAVARARHNRDVLKISEPALDLLEKYLKSGLNHTVNQATRWAGEYHLTVLDEAIKKLAPRFEVNNATELSKQYPAVKYKDALENILRDIGLQTIKFDTIRSKNNDFALAYGIPSLSASGTSSGPAATGAAGTSTSTTPAGATATGSTATAGTGATGTATAGTGATGTAAAGTGATGTPKTPALSINDPKSVALALKTFVPLGTNRQKVVTLLNEAKKLKLNENPIAFCFLLRSMFEISAKLYCNDNATTGLSYKKPNGDDKKLVDVLREITKHLTNNNKNKEAVKTLHGSMAELGKSEGILSVTSMNQLVHNPTFSVTANDISSLFGNIFPLLHAMNQ